MKRKILIIMLTVTLVLSGCGKKAEEADQTATMSQESTKTKGETKETEEQETTQKEETKQEESQESTEETKEQTSGSEESKAVQGTTATNTASTSKASTAGKESQEKENTAQSSQPSKAATGSSQTGNNQTGSKPSAESNNTGNTGNNQPSSTPKPAHTTCTWDGGKVSSAATCNSEGVNTYTCTECGKTRTEGIGKTNHNYVTEKTPATCSEAGKEKISCSICGSVQSENAGEAATGHNMIDSWFGAPPTCSMGGYLNRYCKVCDFLEVSTSFPPLEHVVVDTEIQHGNCREYTVIRHTCSACGEQVKEDTAYLEKDDHDWVWGETEGWDPVNHVPIMVPFERCSRCGISK